MKENIVNMLKKYILPIIVLFLLLSLIFKSNSKYSVIKVNKDIREINDKIESFEKDINHKSDIEKKVNNAIVEKNKVVEEKLSKIDVEGLEFHLPSFLINLGEKANELNVDLTIDEEGIENKPYNALMEFSEEEVEEDDEDDEEAEEVEKKEENEDDIDEEENKENQDFLYITKVPVKVVGSFAKVRSFVKHIDDLGFMEIERMNLVSSGKDMDSKEDTTIIGSFNVEIYHSDKTINFKNYKEGI